MGLSRRPPPFRTSAVLWAITAVWLLAIIGIAVAFVSHLHFGQRPTFSEPSPPSGPVAGAAARSDGVLHLAGSGSNIPLTQRLAGAYRQSVPAARIVVHPSIGSTGGIRAVRDGLVDLAMVSRPLTDEERARQGVVVIAYARVAVVVAAHQSVVEQGLSSAELIEVFRGERRTWRDGTRLVLLLREEGDSSQRAMSRWLPAFRDAIHAAYRSKSGRVIYSDLDMQIALASTPGAVGLFDLGVVTSEQLALKVLAIDGVEPSVDRLHAKQYPVFKDLAFVAAGPVGGATAGFVEFVFSPQGQEAIRSAGYLPLPRSSP